MFKKATLTFPPASMRMCTILDQSGTDGMQMSRLKSSCLNYSTTQNMRNYWGRKLVMFLAESLPGDSTP